MDHSIADELCSDTLKLSNRESSTMSSVNLNQTELYDHELDNSLHDDGSLWGSSPEERNGLSDLDREWQRRHDQFHTIGYRDGLTAGKEASAQEGFNTGFKQSVVVGYNWGLVRGVTSALTCLPAGLREKLIEEQGERDKFQSLFESVHSLSTTDALNLFNEDMMKKSLMEQNEGADDKGIQDQNAEGLQNYIQELKSLVVRSPAIQVDFRIGE
ncbi:hypothetical protein NMG60_11029539 [Bertholletia excelsa]